MAFGLEDAHAEAGEVLEADAEIGAALVLELLLVGLGGDLAHETLGVGRLQRGGLQRSQVAVDAEHGGFADGDVEVGCAFLHGQQEKLFHGYQGVFFGHGVGRGWL